MLEAAVSGLLVIWFDYAWFAVGLMTLLLAAAGGSMLEEWVISYCHTAPNL